ncbi:hypothetical protein [Crocinitomix catalasitica]|uniref:hypothetical protein n=1 Tax=Crocinitomix catalasitica TaxID=184607 RepID=UPI0004862296|nr:hypothetical protein [Crocinitomix catalasitica]
MYKIPWILIIFWLISPILRSFLKIEWNSPELLAAYQQIVGIAFPFTLFVAILTTIKQNDELSSTAVKIVLAIILPLFSMVFFMFPGMCSYNNRNLFYNKESKSIIIERSLNCGAWDSDMPNYKTVKVTPFLGYFNYVSNIDTASIDKTKWIHVIEE